MIVPITNADDPRLQPYRAVGDPELASRERVFIAEGREVVRRLLQVRPAYRVRSMLVSGTARDALGAVLESLDAHVPIFEAPTSVTEAVTGFNIHRGCLALVERPSPRDWQQVARQSVGRPLIVLEDVGNPDNIGGVFRNAKALGAGGVLLTAGCSDPLYRKAIRTSMGAALDVPFAVMWPWPGELADLRTSGWHVIALSPAAPSRLQDCRAHVPRGAAVALLAGHEGHGLTEAALALADQRASIPLESGTDSLNVSVAVAIALYELRRAGPSTDSAMSHCAGT